VSTPLSLIEHLALVPDPRDPKGLIHPLHAILALAVVAMLCGAKSYAAIAQFGRDKGAPLAFALGFRRGKTPGKACLSVLFRKLDIVALEARLAAWALERLPSRERRTLALDGKTARGSRDGEVPGHHLVAAYEGQAALVLGQLRVDAKTNEHKAALELLGVLPIKGNIFTGDAMFCQRDVCEKIVESGGDYVLAVEGNQKGLEVDIGAALAFAAEKRRQGAAFPSLPRG